MGLTTGGFTTYTAIGNREDLTDVIHNISPTETPLVALMGRGRAKAVLHEWQEDSLADATSANAQLEGDIVTVATSAPTARLHNYCQISRKTVAVTGTQEAVDKAGRDSEMAYQVAKRGKELKRDMAVILASNQGETAGGATTARTLRGLPAWLATNAFRGSGGADAAGTTAAATDATAGDLRTYTETLSKQVIAACYSAGAEPTTILVGPVNKQVHSAFTGRTSARQTIGANKIQAAADMYASDFGDLKVVPNRFQRERDAFYLDPEYIKLAYLRPIMVKDLAHVADAQSKYLITEFTLEVGTEAAHGIAADLKTTL